jgi:excisionase family DNA binding protein
MSEPAVLTVEEAAALLRISRSAAYAAVAAGELPACRVGRTWRVPRHRLLEFIDGTEEEVNRHEAGSRRAPGGTGGRVL